MQEIGNINLLKNRRRIFYLRRKPKSFNYKMFSSFKKKKVTIASVSIPELGWIKIKDDQSIIQWINPEQSIVLSINFFELKPDVPTITNVDILRDFYRRLVSGINGGLIEVELLKKNNFPCVRTIFKIPQENSGMMYIASLTLPFENCSFVFKVQAIEVGATGMRETIIANRLISTNALSMNESGNINWAFDPYDNSLKEGNLMNKSEECCYDQEFPSHPLTQARQLLALIEGGLKWSSELETIPAFKK